MIIYIFYNQTLDIIIILVISQIDRYSIHDLAYKAKTQLFKINSVMDKKK
jgi:hypothetical protein